MEKATRAPQFPGARAHFRRSLFDIHADRGSEYLVPFQRRWGIKVTFCGVKVPCYLTEDKGDAFHVSGNISLSLFQRLLRERRYPRTLIPSDICLISLNHRMKHCSSFKLLTFKRSGCLPEHQGYRRGVYLSLCGQHGCYATDIA